ncbi:MAG: site-specific integrase [Phycisphaerales bacterium]|nr:site-specific integrase [Phycisphaerales bacterium]
MREVLPERDCDPVEWYIDGLDAENSRLGMRSALRRLLSAMLDDLAHVTDDHVRAIAWERMTVKDSRRLRATILGATNGGNIRNRKGAALSPASQNKMLAAVRGVVRACCELELINTDRERALLREFRAKKAKTDKVAGRYIKWGERRALFKIAEADETPRGVRDAAILGLLCVGLRRAEIVALDLCDYDRDNGTLAILNSKGQRSRHIFISNGAKIALDRWVNLRGDSDGALLLPVSRGGKQVFYTTKQTKKPRRLDPNSVFQAVRRLADGAGIESLSPHDFRRTAISDLIDAREPLSDIQMHVGHASPVTTSKYDRRGDRAKQRLAKAIQVPFGGGAHVGS